LPKVLTVSWAVEAVARLGGYLEHRSKTPIGIPTFADFSDSSASMMRYTCSPLTSVLVEHHLL
ncbi:hypothetical protein, partial [Nostoc sp.]|uniref:hypothetical protein n=1 Tax=Nostoc sp. TaxID=1180 RepID=UPI002FF06A40